MSDTDKEKDLDNSEEERSPAEEQDRPTEETSPDEAAAEDSSAEDASPDKLLADELQADEPLVDEPLVDEKPAKQRGNGVAWLALLLSFVAVAAAGYMFSRDWLAASDNNADNVLANLESRASSAQQKTDELAARVAELGALDEAGNEELGALRRDLDESIDLLGSVPARMSSLESSVSSLAGISEGARDAWLLAEAEYYMQIANAQLQLANNPHLASLALGMADERLVQLGNPSLTDVRRAIADELAALDVMEKPDIAGATLTLASLARVVESLPLANAGGDTTADDQISDEEQSGVSRAWSSMKGAMSGLVKVTPPDQAKLALMTPDGEYFLRNNLALQLQSARLALLRGEQAVFQQSLDDTSEILTEYFDGSSAQVQSAQETLVEIRGSISTGAAPDISGSLQQLRQFRTLRESSQ